MKKNNKKIYGVILAAGRGNRIQPLSFDLPKPLLPICNKPIIQYQIEYMRDLGIDDFVVVVGHLKEKIQNYFGDGSSLKVRIRYVEQKEKLGIAHAVGQLENYIDRPFMLFLGDIFIVPKNLSEMIRIFDNKKAGAVLAVKKESDSDSIRKNFTVLLHPKDGRVKRVIEKPRYLTTYLKGCGVYLLDLSIFDAIRNTPRTAMRDEYEITTAIQILIDDGCPVYVADVVKWDMNVTVSSDLFRCNQKWLENIGRKNVIHSEARINKSAQIINSVIGKNVIVKYPILIKNSVILEGAKVFSKGSIINRLVSSVYNIACSDTES